MEHRKHQKLCSYTENDRGRNETGRCRRSDVEAVKTGIVDQGHCFTAQCFTEFQNSGIAGRIVAGCMEYPTGGCGIFGEGGRTLSETWKTVKESGGSSGRKRTKQFQRFSGGDKFKPECGLLQQINQTYAYIQLPLHLRQGEHKTGELFVYTNKKNLAGRDGRVSALLHLDMEHLGPLDVYVALQDTKVSTKFYVQNDTILDYLEANMEVLTQRLKQRGYDCNCETTLRTELQQTAQAMAPILKAGGSVPVAQYAFDVRT